ncbi:MAG: hypothetical protein AAFY88_30360, partial [Acidobacteriota bacterium]
MIRPVAHRLVRAFRRRHVLTTAARAVFACLVAFAAVVAPGSPLDAQVLDVQVLEPTFLVESIRVDGLERASAELIVAESLLEPGFEYVESELQQAVFRIQRLPFVLDATFLIERGTERGRYRLVIQVEEIKRWFFGEDGVFTQFTNSVAFDNPIADDWTFSSSPLAGIRLFAGRYNVFFAALSGGSVGAQVGYTRYNLFDRRIVFNLGLTAGGCCATE